VNGVHVLVVEPFDPESDDWYDVEHLDDCPRRDLEGLPGAWEYACGVEFYLGEEGIGSYWHHADDPDCFADWTDALKPGRYKIEVWHKRHPGGPWGAEEWDGGLRLVEEAA
jgi:hypothetical protein